MRYSIKTSGRNLNVLDFIQLAHSKNWTRSVWGEEFRPDADHGEWYFVTDDEEFYIRVQQALEKQMETA